MRYVPSLPPPITAPEETGEVHGLTAIRPAKPVQQRTLVPLVKQRFAPREPAAEAEKAKPADRQTDQRSNEDRRTYRRRVSQQPVLLDLRPGGDRRRRSQRITDVATSIDEEA